MKILRNPIYTALTISRQELIDLVASIDYVSTPECLPTNPIYFLVQNEGELIKGMAGLDKEEYQVLYVEDKLVNKQDPDVMEYEQIEQMMTENFHLKDDSIVYLMDGCFTGKAFRPNYNVPVTDSEGNPAVNEYE